MLRFDTRRNLRGFGPRGVTVALLLCVGAAACGGFTHVRFSPQTSVPGGTELRSERVRVPLGRAVGVIAVPMEDDEEMDEDTLLELSSDNPQILGVAPTLDERSFVFYGVSEGTTSIRVFVDGDEEGQIDAVVFRQPAGAPAPGGGAP